MRENQRRRIIRSMKRFRDAFLEHVDASGEPLNQIAERAGVSVQQIYKLKRRQNATTSVDSAVKIAAAFGETLDEFLAESPGTTPHQVTALYMQLPDDLRQRLIDYAEGLRDAAGRSRE